MNTTRSSRFRRALPAGAMVLLCLLVALGLVALGSGARAQDRTAEEAVSESSEGASGATQGGAGARPGIDLDDIEVLVIEGAIFDEAEAAVLERVSSDELVNVMTAEEFAKYSAVDVADALKRVAGLNVVEGQFAIIRGLEDRYSSTLFNGGAVPSPDPDSQSIQLDLFPAEVVSNLVVSKTFGPDLPSNSAAGAIDVVTSGYPEEFELGFKAKGGFNDNAINDYLEWEDDTPVGNETDGWDTLGQEYGGFIGGRTSLFGREVRMKAVGNWGIDYDTAEGFQEDREPRTRFAAPPDGDLQNGELSLTGGRFDLTTSEREEQTTAFVGVGFDLDEESSHSIDFTLFWTKKDEETVQLRENGYYPRFDYLKPDGPVDRENRGLPVDFSTNFAGNQPGGGPGNASDDSWIGKSRDITDDNPEKGFLWFSSFLESKSFKTERDLLIPQINGDHLIDAVPGLQIRWAANYAETSQEEEALGARMWYEPCGFSADPRLACPEGTARIDVPTQFPTTVRSLGAGRYLGNEAIISSDTEIDETSWFGRIDGEYETEVTDWLKVALETGGWYERADRDVSSFFLPRGLANVSFPCIDSGICGGDLSSSFTFGDSLQQLGERLFGFAYARDLSGRLVGTVETESEAKREIQALHLGNRTTLWENLDLLVGARFENILIESNNDPFIAGFDSDLSPLIFPSKYLLFDRFGDNVVREGFLRDPPYNDQVLGLRVNPGPCRGRNPAPGVAPPPTPVLPGTCVDLADQAEIQPFINGKIDEEQVLPSVGINWRPIEGLALRAAWSQTVARPSFREMGYYVTVEPGSDDLIVGNPQLQLSDVDSYDARVEYFFGEAGDLAAFSVFYKTIEDPIESIVLRNPSDLQESSATDLFRTYFNNPNEATLWGVELEARKTLGFVRDAGQWGLRSAGADPGYLDVDLFDYFSIGGNFTWIEAEVDRTEAELLRSEPFFAAGSRVTQNESRRLFGQPEWIANADVSFDHPEWGTRATLAFYAISDVLDAAGGATINRAGEIDALTLDRYIDSFHTLDLILKQTLWQGLAVKFTAKNLTDSRRQIVYDPVETSDTVEERSYKVGRDFSLELSYTFFEFPTFFAD